MRGIWIKQVLMKLLQRFTPAYAGNIFWIFLPFHIIQVHPRVCGEYSVEPLITVYPPGSPPRMRGISSHRCPCFRHQRFTPAYAGNIIAFGNILQTIWVHPRVCGEYFIIGFIFAFILGSPPRMRGISLHIHIGCVILRFTPAYAGNIQK